MPNATKIRFDYFDDPSNITFRSDIPIYIQQILRKHIIFILMRIITSEISRSEINEIPISARQNNTSESFLFLRL